jgi:Amt family ammonium transporter
MAVRRLFTNLSLLATVCILLAVLASPVWAQAEGGGGLDASGLHHRVSEVETTAKDAALAGNNAWMLTCCALVLFMTAPGLALFYGGLVRKKNVLGVMMQCFFLMGLMTIIWALYGYTLAFGGSFDGLMAEGSVSNPYIGNLDHLFMNGIERVWDEEANSPHTPMNGAIPAITFMLFQGMFFIITPALICGAYAERMKFSTMVVFTIL